MTISKDDNRSPLKTWLGSVMDAVADADPDELEMQDLRLWHYFLVRHKKFRFVDLP